MFTIPTHCSRSTVTFFHHEPIFKYRNITLGAFQAYFQDKKVLFKASEIKLLRNACMQSLKTNYCSQIILCFSKVFSKLWSKFLLCHHLKTYQFTFILVFLFRLCLMNSQWFVCYVLSFFYASSVSLSHHEKPYVASLKYMLHKTVKKPRSISWLTQKSSTAEYAIDKLCIHSFSTISSYWLEAKRKTKIVFTTSGNPIILCWYQFCHFMTWGLRYLRLSSLYLMAVDQNDVKEISANAWWTVQSLFPEPNISSRGWQKITARKMSRGLAEREGATHNFDM